MAKPRANLGTKCLLGWNDSRSYHMQSLKPAYTQTWQNRHWQIGRSGFFSEMLRRGGGPAFNLSNIKVHIDTLYIHGHFASLENYALFGHWLDRVQTPVCISKYLKFYFPGMCPRSKPSTILSKWEQQMNDLFFWVFLFCFDFCLRFWQLFISLVEALVIRGCKLCGKSWKAGEEERVKGHFRTFHPRN